jgi:dGTPase
MIEAVVSESLTAGAVVMAPAALAAMHELRDFMFHRVYLRPEVDDQRERAITIIRTLVDHYIRYPEEIPDTYRQDDASTATRAIDYVSGMTDRFAIRDWERITPQ